MVISIPQSDASPIYTIENLDDLIDAYNSGMIDYRTYAILYNAYDLGGLTESDLLALNITDRSELNYLLDREDSTGFWHELLTVDRGRIGARRYSRDKDYIYGNYFGDLSTRGFDIQFEIREFEKSHEFRRRSISWSNENFSIKAGNYLVREGYGLTIGRYDYQPSSGFDKKPDLYFISPINSYYNGVNTGLAYRGFTASTYYSYKEYDYYHKNFLGGSIGLEHELLRAGLFIGFNKFENDTLINERLAMGASFKIYGEDYKLGAEFASVKKSGAGNI